MSEYNVLGVDQSLSHTVGHHDGCGVHTKFEMHGDLPKGTPHDKGSRQLHRLSEIVADFRSHLASCESVCDCPGYMFIEGYAMGSKFGREALGELGGNLKLAALNANWDIVVVQPTSLKKFLVAGKAEKNAMMLHCYKQFGYTPTDDDDADAYCLMKLGTAFIDWRLGKDTPKRHVDVFKQLEVISPRHRKAA